MEDKTFYIKVEGKLLDKYDVAKRVGFSRTGGFVRMRDWEESAKDEEALVNLFRGPRADRVVILPSGMKMTAGRLKEFVPGIPRKQAQKRIGTYARSARGANNVANLFAPYVARERELSKAGAFEGLSGKSRGDRLGQIASGGSWEEKHIKPKGVVNVRFNPTVYGVRI